MAYILGIQSNISPQATFLYQKVAFMQMLRHEAYLPKQENQSISAPGKEEMDDMLK